MNMLLKIIKNNKLLLLFIFLHLAFLNINYAEWGDSYRILRASEYIRQFSYPDDEKRQPFYSVILAIRPDGVDPIFWGRSVMFVVSITFFIIFSKYLNLLKITPRTKNLSQILFIFNPILFYWSIRIMADVFFGLVVLWSFYIFQKTKNNHRFLDILALSLLSATAILTRFEGYILAFSMTVGLLYETYKHKLSLLEIIKRSFGYAVMIIIFILPWFLYRNPFYSKYFNEPSGRSYDFKMIVTYIASLANMLGFTVAAFFIYKNIRNLKKILPSYTGEVVFIIMELILALVWPAAIPRLFVPIIFFVVILSAYSIDSYFKDDANNNRSVNFAVLAILLLGYILIQYFLKLQFLVSSKLWFILVILLQMGLVYTIVFKRFKLFYIILVSSMSIWTYATIIIHKDIFRAIVEANKYVAQNLQGTVVYNDVSSISDWYLNQNQDSSNLVGIYLNMDSRKNRKQEVIARYNADYILITNEHNPDLEFDSKESTYLEEINNFSYTINNKKFFTKIAKVIK